MPGSQCQRAASRDEVAAGLKSALECCTDRKVSVGIRHASASAGDHHELLGPMWVSSV